MGATVSAGRTLARTELAARIRARKDLESQAIAEGVSDIAYDEPLTAAERAALGLDRRAFDADEDATQSESTAAHA